MKIQRTINTSVEKFDEFIYQMIIADIKQTTKKKFNPSMKLEGYKYSKQMESKTGKSGKVNVKVEILRSGQYKVSFTSKEGVNYIHYQYEDNGNNTSRLKYEETFEGKDKTKGLNHSLMMFFYKRSSKKRANIILDQIESILYQDSQY